MVQFIKLCYNKFLVRVGEIMNDEKLNKIKKNLMIIFVLVIIIVVVALYAIKADKEAKEYAVINDIVKVALNSEGTNMIYIGGKNCENCDMQAYQMKMFLSEYKISYYYISIDSISDSKARKVLKDLGLDTSIELPTIAIYKDGNISVSQSGLVGTNSLYNLFKNNNLIRDEKLKLNYLTITTYVEKVAEDNVVLALGSMKSEKSIIFEEILWNLATENQLDINFLYTSNLNQSEGKLFESKISNFDDYELAVPSLIVVNNGVIKDALIGLYDAEDYLDFLKENDIIK